MTIEDNYLTKLESLFEVPVYDVSQVEKERLLVEVLATLHQHHVENCESYQRLASTWKTDNIQLSDIPFVAVRLFKLLALKSVPESKVLKCLTSSGTSGQVPAKIFLDAITSRWQSKVLVRILQQFLGKQRLPMLIIDSPGNHQSGSRVNARFAGIQGLAMFGRDHTYALNNDMTVDWEAVEAFCRKYENDNVLVFGFTFMVWHYFIAAIKSANRTVRLPNAHLFHSGGWKKLQSQSVDNHTFKAGVLNLTGIPKVTNFYGMAEQVGTVFMECEHGFLHAPSTADVVFRDCYDFSELNVGQTGLIQVLSALPYSYPGFSILTEDLGTLHGVDDCQCGRKGKYFTVESRLPKVELRGCSDTAAAAS
ncbi:acyl-protein synthetase [Alteromonas sp. KUL49]|nr:acyl-protein synthetase [Alteromonas sp. KUL49]